MDRPLHPSIVETLPHRLESYTFETRPEKLPDVTHRRTLTHAPADFEGEAI